MTDRELMQQALVALGAMQSYAAAEKKGLRICDEAIEALRARLAQPEQEPVAWIKERELLYMQAVAAHGKTDWKTNLGLKPEDGDVPLYTAPPQQHSEQWWKHEVSNAYAEGYEKGRASVKQPEQEPVATLFGSLPVYDVPPKQEPVAWMHNFIDEVVIAHRPVDLDRHPDRWTPLYKDPTPCQTCEALARTVMMDQVSYDIPPRHREPPTQDLSAPLTVNGVPMYPQREWQGLTDEEIKNHWLIAMQSVEGTVLPIPEFARAIEAKLKEKNA